MHTLVNWKRADKNSLEAVIHYENLDEHFSLMHCLVCRRYAQCGESFWGLLSIVPRCYLLRSACSPSLQWTPVPFSVRPQRPVRLRLKCCKWDTDALSPSKGRWKNNRIMGFKPEMNILFIFMAWCPNRGDRGTSSRQSPRAFVFLFPLSCSEDGGTAAGVGLKHHFRLSSVRSSQCQTQARHQKRVCSVGGGPHNAGPGSVSNR